MWKRMFVLVLSLVICVMPLSIINALSIDEEEILPGEGEKQTDNPYNKLHFYFDVGEHSTIDDRNELEQAMNTITQSNIVVYQRETLDDGNSSDWIALTYN